MPEKSTKQRQSKKKTTKPKESAATPPQVVQEYSTLDGDRLRVVIEHAPGIDYYVVVERLDKTDNATWTPIKRPLKETLFNPVNAAMEVAIMQLAAKLASAEATIRRLEEKA